MDSYFWTQPDADFPGYWTVCCNRENPVMIAWGMLREKADALSDRLQREREAIFASGQEGR